MLAEALQASRQGTFLHPGKAFVSSAGLPSGSSDLFKYLERYTCFLRREAGTERSQTPNLQMILFHFGLKAQRGVLGARQRGLIAPDMGLILLNGADAQARQRYTLAHELIELLFEALSQEPLPRGLRAMCRGSAKEQLCEAGAAMLLMPDESVRRLMNGSRPSLHRLPEVARLFDVSMTAALIRIVRLTGHPTTLTVWRRLEQASGRRHASPGQLPLFVAERHGVAAQLRLRLGWYVQAPCERHRALLPRMEAPAGSPIQQALSREIAFLGVTELHLGPSYRGRFHVEARRYRLGSDPCVFALLTRISGETSCLRTC